MYELKEFYWIPIEKMGIMNKTELNCYFEMILNQIDLNSPESLERFKECATEAIQKHGTNSIFVKPIEQICKKYNIKIEISVG